ncbi:hypothetical protein [Streptosporangium pseudovulgare]|uniref:Uncharacterized protein n=1 Tax=Streptosporangium pseudovulgare TaxID=35765 RepID=A0ABQ2QJ85_9ACTN|nr:hypothetical protein [Streptosporangium pseudovulgare]GGP81996.1 hypothetical protein GCM10010140_08330 [Streptosporangium pseudovulgare]
MGVLTAVAFAVTALLLVGGFAVVTRRLLDLRFGVVRTLLAGGLVALVLGPLMKAFSGAVDVNDQGVTPLPPGPDAGAAHPVGPRLRRRRPVSG